MEKNINYETQWDFNDRFPGICIHSEHVNADNTYYDNLFFTPHWHERIEIWQLHDGEVQGFCNNSSFHATSGDIVIINPLEVHSAKMFSPVTIYDCFIVDINSLVISPDERVKQRLYDIMNGKTKLPHVVRDDFAWELLSKISTLNESNRYTKMFLSGLFTVILSIILAYCPDDKANDTPMPDDIMVNVLDYIYSEYKTNVTLDEMSKAFCLSKSHFCRRFKAQIGEPPIGFLNTVRVNKAYELLSNTTLSVTDICSKTGFSDMNSFNRQFKQRLGFSPSYIRKNKKS